MKDPEGFASRLASERKRVGLTQAQFAEACGVKAASQFLYEKGERSPNAEYLIKAQNIGVSIGFLFKERDDPSLATSFSKQELAQLYKQTDDACRDEQGRLLDLELRVRKFLDLLNQNIYSFRKSVNS